MDKIRWVSFVLGVLMVVATPSAVFSAIRLVRSNHSVAPLVLLTVAFVVRFTFIWFFFHLWWKHRPASQEQS